MKIEKCPSCGNPIEHIYNHKCPYCRNPLNTDNKGIKQEIDLRNVRNIELIRLERDPLTPNFYLIYKGIETDIRPMYEISNSKAILFNNVQNVKFGFTIPIEETLKLSMEEIIERRVPEEILDEVLYATYKYMSINEKYNIFRRV